jgi:hypothetical protein
MKTAVATPKTPYPDDEFVKNLMDSTQTHDQWLAFVRFGLNTLLRDQKLLMTLIVTEAQREAARRGSEGPTVIFAQIFEELDLKLVVAGGNQ